LTTIMARDYLVNCQNHLVTNFKRKLRRWVFYKVRKHVGLLLNFEKGLLDQISHYVMLFLLPRNNDDVIEFPAAVRGTLVSQHHGYLLFSSVDMVLQKAQDLVNGLSLGTNEIKRSWPQYVRPFWRILRTFKKHSHSDALERRISRRRGRGLRLFTLAPIAYSKVHYISIDTDTLHQLLRATDGLAREVPTNARAFRDNAMNWWTRF
jgi:hypothetical protein